MNYWFTPAGLAFLVLTVVFGGSGAMIQFFAPNPDAAPFFYMAAGICGLVAGYCIIRRRHAVGRFYNVFGFMPSDQAHDEWCRPLVEKEIRYRAGLLQDAYQMKDAARDAMSRVADSPAAKKAVGRYRDAMGHVSRCRALYARVLNGATSKWLPAPYAQVSRKLEDWSPRRPRIVVR